MIGHVDSQGRALLKLEVGHPTTGTSKACALLVDTGFNGFLVLNQRLIDSLSLPLEATSHAILADGSQVEVKSYLGQIDWFGQTVIIDIIAGHGEEGLLGVGLMMSHRLSIDYSDSSVELS